jgi:peptidoglycan hydrolase CwlO-like protein
MPKYNPGLALAMSLFMIAILIGVAGEGATPGAPGPPKIGPQIPPDVGRPQVSFEPTVQSLARVVSDLQAEVRAIKESVQGLQNTNTTQGNQIADVKSRLTEAERKLTKLCAKQPSLLPGVVLDPCM